MAVRKSRRKLSISGTVIDDAIEMNRVGHGLIAGVIGMQRIADVGGEQERRVIRVAKSLVEIDHAIERPAGSDPLIDCLALRFACGCSVVSHVDCVGSAERGESAAVDELVGVVSLRNDLLMRRDDIGGLCGTVADVIDALENNHCASPQLVENIAGEPIGSGVSKLELRPDGEKFIAGNARVDDRQSGAFAGDELASQIVRIPAVGVVDREVAVGDGIAERDEGALDLWRCSYIDSGEEHPAGDFLSERLKRNAEPVWSPVLSIIVVLIGEEVLRRGSVLPRR